MSQHDYVIDNAPGLAVRTDIVAALQALASLNSGPLEPVTKYAGMLWLDTSQPPNGILKMRDLSNTTWTFPSIYGDDRVGECAFFARPTPPVGWLKANGANVSRNTYSALFAVIGTQFGVGDGVNTFTLPDMRGQFVRGWDDGRGMDPSRTFGSNQTDAFGTHGHTGSTSITAGGSHAHSGTSDTQGWHGHGASTDGQGNHAHSPANGGGFVSYFGGGTNMGSTGGGSGVNQGGGTNAAGNHGHNVSIAGDGNHAHNMTVNTEPAHTHTATTTITATATSETRPVNISLLGCIRYA